MRRLLTGMVPTIQELYVRILPHLQIRYQFQLSLNYAALPTLARYIDQLGNYLCP